jgi:hypothetical protein
MDQQIESTPAGISQAITLIRQGDIDAARQALGISSDFTDEQINDGLIEFDKGMRLFLSQKHIESLPHLSNALTIVQASSDEESKFFFSICTQMANGVATLFQGDAHGAAATLSALSEQIDKTSFYMPQLKTMAYSMKALSLVALAKTHLFASDMASAEKLIGEVRNVHDEFLIHIDTINDEETRVMAAAEVYGTRLEITFAFICAKDLPTLDLGMWIKRINQTKSDADSLRLLIDVAPKGPITQLIGQYPPVYDVLSSLHHLLDLAIAQRKPLNKNEIQLVTEIGSDLFEIEQALEKCDARASGLRTQVRQLMELHKNLIAISKIAIKDFGRFGGMVSFVSFVALIFIIHLTIRPSEAFGIFYYFGALILALIVGFGFGALRFQPLLRILAKASTQNN